MIKTVREDKHRNLRLSQFGTTDSSRVGRNLNSGRCDLESVIVNTRWGFPGLAKNDEFGDIAINCGYPATNEGATQRIGTKFVIDCVVGIFDVIIKSNFKPTQGA